jgi:hypothetical protein
MIEKRFIQTNTFGLSDSKVFEYFKVLLIPMREPFTRMRFSTEAISQSFEYAFFPQNPLLELIEYQPIEIVTSQ